MTCGLDDTCYSIDEICIFKLDECNNLIPCHAGEHIQHCKHFTCNSFFKCPNYYCIPWKYVCDGKRDCPFGLDESVPHCGSRFRKCTNLYRCREAPFHFSREASVYSFERSLWPGVWLSTSWWWAILWSSKVQSNMSCSVWVLDLCSEMPWQIVN